MSNINESPSSPPSLSIPPQHNQRQHQLRKVTQQKCQLSQSTVPMKMLHLTKDGLDDNQITKRHDISLSLSAWSLEEDKNNMQNDISNGIEIASPLEMLISDMKTFSQIADRSLADIYRDTIENRDEDEDGDISDDCGRSRKSCESQNEFTKDCRKSIFVYEIDHTDSGCSKLSRNYSSDDEKGMEEELRDVLRAVDSFEKSSQKEEKLMANNSNEERKITNLDYIDDYSPPLSLPKDAPDDTGNNGADEFTIGEEKKIMSIAPSFADVQHKAKIECVQFQMFRANCKKKEQLKHQQQEQDKIYNGESNFKENEPIYNPEKEHYLSSRYHYFNTRESANTSKSNKKKLLELEEGSGRFHQNEQKKLQQMPLQSSATSQNDHSKFFFENAFYDNNNNEDKNDYSSGVNPPVIQDLSLFDSFNEYNKYDEHNFSKDKNDGCDTKNNLPVPAISLSNLSTPLSGLSTSWNTFTPSISSSLPPIIDTGSQNSRPITNALLPSLPALDSKLYLPSHPVTPQYSKKDINIGSSCSEIMSPSTIKLPNGESEHGHEPREAIVPFYSSLPVRGKNYDQEQEARINNYVDAVVAGDCLLCILDCPGKVRTLLSTKMNTNSIGQENINTSSNRKKSFQGKFVRKVKKPKKRFSVGFLSPKSSHNQKEGEWGKHTVHEAMERAKRWRVLAEATRGTKQNYDYNSEKIRIMSGVDILCESPSLSSSLSNGVHDKERITLEGVRRREGTKHTLSLALRCLEMDEVGRALILFEDVLTVMESSSSSSEDKENEIIQHNRTPDTTSTTLDYETPTSSIVWIGIVLHHIGLIELRCGRYNSALIILQRATKVRRSCIEHGIGDDLDLAASTSKLGVAYFALDDFFSAQKFFERTCSILSSSPGNGGSSSSHMAEALNNLACTWFEIGQRAVSLRIFKESLDLQSSLLVDGACGGGLLYKGNTVTSRRVLANLAKTKSNIAYVYLKMKRSEIAIHLWNEVLLDQVRHFDEKDPCVLTTMDYLAMANVRSGYKDKATKLYSQILKLQIETIGATHKDCAVTLGKIKILTTNNGKVGQYQQLDQQSNNSDEFRQNIRVGNLVKFMGVAKRKLLDKNDWMRRGSPNAKFNKLFI